MRARSVVVILILYLHVPWSAPCPPSCRCMLSLTNCNSKNLQKVPSGIPDYTTVLVLSHNNISSIQTNDFNELPNLRILIISNSSLTFFDTEVIKKFKDLTVLDLSRNRLTEISKFPRHMKIKSVELYGNLLTHISSNTFSLLKNTSYIKLADNRISNISVDTFRGLVNLTRLNLKNNSISTLGSGIFSGLTKLRIIGLSDNYLKKLPDKKFQDNHKLERVLLNKNNLIKLGKNLFSNLNELRHVHLSMNNLTYIHPNTFTGLNNLQSIYIYGNQIPCSCSFLKMINSHLLVDCFLRNETISRTDKNLTSKWSNWAETGSKSFYIRVRLCEDCSELRYNRPCSPYKSENSTCIMVEGRRGKFRPPIASKRQVMMDRILDCLYAVNVISIKFILLGSVALVVVSLLCAYFLKKCRTRHKDDIPTKNGNDPTKDDKDTTKDDNDPTKDDNDTTKDDKDTTKNDNDPTKDDNDPTKDENDTTKDNNDTTKDDNDQTKDDNDQTKRRQ